MPAEAPGLFQAVVDDGGDLPPVLTVSLLFDHGGHSEHLVDGASAVRHLLAHLIGELGVEGLKHLVDGVQGIVGRVELVGGGEQVALQPLGVTQGNVLEEGEGVVVGGRRLVQVLHRGHPLLLQELEDLGYRVALRDGDIHHCPGGGIGADAGDQGAVVHVGVQGKGAGRGDLVLAAGDGGEELEERFVLDQAVVLQGVGHLVQGGIFLNGDGGGVLGLIEGQHIAGSHPAQRRQQRRDADDEDHIEHGSIGTKAPLALPSGAVGPGGAESREGGVVREDAVLREPEADEVRRRVSPRSASGRGYICVPGPAVPASVHIPVTWIQLLTVPPRRRGTAAGPPPEGRRNGETRPRSACTCGSLTT